MIYVDVDNYGGMIDLKEGSDDERREVDNMKWTITILETGKELIAATAWRTAELATLLMRAGFHIRVELTAN